LERLGSFAAAGVWLRKCLVDQSCIARPDFFSRAGRELFPTIGAGSVAGAMACDGTPDFQRLFGRSDATAENSSRFSAFSGGLLSRLLMLCLYIHAHDCGWSLRIATKCASEPIFPAAVEATVLS
jgi:hypothetical protein